MCKKRGIVSFWLSVCFEVSTIEIVLKRKKDVRWGSQWIIMINIKTLEQWSDIHWTSTARRKVESLKSCWVDRAQRETETLPDMASWQGLFRSIQTDRDIIASKTLLSTFQPEFERLVPLNQWQETLEGPHLSAGRSNQSRKLRRAFTKKNECGAFPYVLYAQNQNGLKNKMLCWSQPHKYNSTSHTHTRTQSYPKTQQQLRL